MEGITVAKIHSCCSHGNNPHLERFLKHCTTKEYLSVLGTILKGMKDMLTFGQSILDDPGSVHESI